MFEMLHRSSEISQRTFATPSRNARKPLLFSTYLISISLQDSQIHGPWKAFLTSERRRFVNHPSDRATDVRFIFKETVARSGHILFPILLH
jgi:hypothetical protein